MEMFNPTRIRRGALRVLLVPALAVLGLAACHDDRPVAGSAPAREAAFPKSVADHFEVGLGDRIVHLQFAILDAETHRGLMERGPLGPDEGMIFVYRAPQQLNFWMHDTPTPLDIGFFTPAGELAEIYPLLPFDEKTVSSRGLELQFAIEMNQGWYQASGVKPGARLDMGAVAAALRARGFDPRKFGIGPP
jgi:uncharacterized membrane protein (UPF0127 family)